MKKIFLLIFLFLFAGTLTAAQYDIKQMTPEIQQALQGRQSRYDSLQHMKSQGIIGENNSGYVEVLKNAVPDAPSVVSAENQDRRVIYQAIVQQNNLPAAGLEQVEAVFADVQREKARSGDSIQTASGSWVQK